MKHQLATLPMKISKLPNGEPEIYVAMQGEGASIGKTFVFVRLAICNLRCTWCDTKYTWDFKTKEEKDNAIIEMTPQEVGSYINQLSYCNIIFTGGEPMMQQSAILRVIDELPNDCYVEIETNGTIAPTDELIHSVARFNISPKLNSSGNMSAASSERYLKTLNQYKKAILKFVICKDSYEEDMKEINTIISLLDKDNIEDIYLMPEGVTKEKIEEGLEFLEKNNRGYLISPRLHIMIHGNRRLT